VADCFADNQQQKLLALISRLEELPSTAELARNLCAA
jgi:hypothetical protein